MTQPISRSMMSTLTFEDAESIYGEVMELVSNLLEIENPEEEAETVECIGMVLRRLYGFTAPPAK
jgi:hypothetical protein